jgi:amidase
MDTTSLHVKTRKSVESEPTASSRDALVVLFVWARLKKENLMDNFTKDLIILGVLGGGATLASLADRCSRRRRDRRRCAPVAGNEIWRLDALALADAIGRGEISSREATQAMLDRIAAVNPKLNAVTVVHAEQALAAADRADAAVRRGDRLGPLHGVPTTIKENTDVEGDATTNGLVAMKDVIAPSDSPFVRAWRKAGMVIIGRTNLSTLSVRWHTDNMLRGATVNPWHRDLTPGGSSGGAAASLAAGICPIVHANDLGGSVRYPASCCGVVGIRPGLGRIAQFNASAKKDRLFSAQLMGVQGLMARKVADVRVGLQPLIAEPDYHDPWWAPVLFAGSPLPKPMRVALASNGGTSVHPDVLAAMRAAGKALAEEGYAVEEVEIPSVEAAGRCFLNLALSELRYMTIAGARQVPDQDFVRYLDFFMASSPAVGLDGYTQALADRVVYVRQWQEFQQKYPIILMPVSTQPPFAAGGDIKDQQTTNAIVSSQLPMLAVSVIGAPAVSVPVGVYNGVPLGVQLVAPRWREDLCLEAAEAIERRRGVVTPIDPQF